MGWERTVGVDPWGDWDIAPPVRTITLLVSAKKFDRSVDRSWRGPACFLDFLISYFLLAAVH